MVFRQWVTWRPTDKRSFNGASRGGGFEAGTVLQLSLPSSGGGTWTGSLLYTFTGYPDGGYPQNSLVFSHSTLYWRDL
jgi:hypothetical protein